MNHATQNRSRNYKSSKREKAISTASTVMRLCRVDETSQRCERSKKRPTEISSDNNASDAFLKCRFLPKLREAEILKTIKNTDILERDFYQSLSNLKEHYGIHPMQTESFDYPYNLALAIHDVKEQLKSKERNWEEIRLIKKGRKTYFTSEEKFDTGAVLYYIPIVPLYHLSKNHRRKKAGHLLQSVCAYLYHIADIPYYRQESSYLYYIYDILKEWAIDDEEEESLTLLSESNQAEWIGDYMEKKIFNSQNLINFNSRIKRFRAKDQLDKDCLDIALKAYDLFTEYPDKRIFHNAQNFIIETDDEEQENIVSMDKYLSFCANGTGSLFNQIFNSVNNELQEFGHLEEPVVIKRFEGCDISNISLDFENRIFPLIEELIDVLNNF